MKQKPKKCKGINKAHGYEGCGKEVLKRTYGLCSYCYWDWMQNTEGGQVHYKKQFIPRVERRTKKEIKKKERQRKESLKTIARLKNDARIPFQKWIRARDANDACISCGTTTAKIWHSGHYFKAEVFSGLVFNEMNVNKQCEKCNTFLDGNESEYRKGLVKKYGEQEVKELEAISDSLRDYKYDREELREIKKEYQRKLKEL